MSVAYDKEINKETSWDGDESTHHLPVRGRRIEEFLKKELNSLSSEDEVIKKELNTERNERIKKSVSTFPQDFSREEKNIIKKNIDFEWHDDGSGNVVPVKHPDLSTQPSILPYKFAGNYVYEQMFYIPAPIVTEGDYYKPLNYDVKGNIIILDHSLCLIDANGYTMSSDGYHICCYDDIVKDGTEYLEGLLIRINNGYPNNLNSITGAWVRVVWSAAPKIIEDDYYYYQQQKVGRFLLSMSATEDGYKYRLNETSGGATIYEGNFITGGQVQLPPEFLDDFIDGGLNLKFVNPDNAFNNIAAILNDENHLSIYAADPSGELSWDNFKYYFPKTCESLLNGNDVNFTITTT